jgi:hypothetical protein
MGMAAQLRQAFLDAQDYAQKWADFERKKGESDKDERGKKPEQPKRDLKLEALIPYLQGKKPIVLAAEEASESGNRRSSGSRIQSKVRAEPYQPLATNPGRGSQPEGASHCGSDLRKPQALRAL